MLRLGLGMGTEWPTSRQIFLGLRSWLKISVSRPLVPEAVRRQPHPYSEALGGGRGGGLLGLVGPCALNLTLLALYRRPHHTL